MLGVVIPYRDRKKHLEYSLPRLEKYFKSKNLEYKIVIVEQCDKKPFNRGRLLNIGYDFLKNDCDYFCFHDIDMIPMDADYSFVPYPCHLATELSSCDYDIPYDTYFGGVTLFPKEDFELINGYSNQYWGWGFEDDDLFWRCLDAGLPTDTMEVGQDSLISNSMVFSNSHIEIPNIDFKKSFSIVVRCLPYKIVSDKNKNYDECFIVSRPGYHSGISFDSFNKYKTEIWLEDKEKGARAIQTDILYESWTQLVMTIDLENYNMSFFKDGVFEDDVNFYGDVKDYGDVPLILGAGNPLEDGNEFYFNGELCEFMFYENVLDDDEIYKLYNKSLSIPPTSHYYDSSKYLSTYYDFKNIVDEKVVDIMGNRHGVVIGCTPNYERKEHKVKVDVPKRKSSKYICLSHDTNGWDNGNWKHKETRLNQIKFFNEVRNDISSDGYKIDGLNTLRYKIKEKEETENLSIIGVV